MTSKLQVLQFILTTLVVLNWFPSAKSDEIKFYSSSSEESEDSISHSGDSHTLDSPISGNSEHSVRDKSETNEYNSPISRNSEHLVPDKIEANEYHSPTSADSEDLVPDKDIESVCNTLRTVDKTLTEMMTDLPVDGGSKMMRLIKTYNAASRILLEHCKNDQHNAFMTGEDLLEQGGPQFLTVDIDENQLQKSFSWEKSDLHKMHNAWKTTNTVWYDLFRLYNNIPK